MSIDSLAFAFSIGLLGAGHCLGMCGGIAAALSFAMPKADRFTRFRILFTYNTGRILSYGLAGLLFGWLAQTAVEAWMKEFGMPILRSIAGLFMILMGAYVAQWSRLLTILERGGGIVWRKIEPFGRALMPVNNELQALALGGIWGWLPCGLIYSALAYAVLQGSALQSSLTMVAFGLGTLPAVLLGGLAGASIKALIQQKSFRIVSAVLLMLFGIWTMWSAFYHAFYHQHQGHQGHDHHHIENRELDTLIYDAYCGDEKINPILEE